MTVAEARGFASEVASNGWRVVELPDGIRDGTDFVSALNAAALPLDPPMTTVRVWWALMDSLSSALDSLDDARVAIVWADPSAMIDHAPREYDEAVWLLSYLAQHSPEWSPPELLVVMGEAE
jgi:hypothetical protein